MMKKYVYYYALCAGLGVVDDVFNSIIIDLGLHINGGLEFPGAAIVLQIGQWLTKVQTAYGYYIVFIPACAVLAFCISCALKLYSKTTSKAKTVVKAIILVSTGVFVGVAVSFCCLVAMCIMEIYDFHMQEVPH